MTLLRLWRPSLQIDTERYDAVTFDCYGTLIDWDTGVADVFGPWAAAGGFPGTVSDLTAAFARQQHSHQRARPFRNYRRVIRDALADAVAELGGTITPDDLDVFAASVGSWPAFADTIDALRHLKRRGLHLGVVSNVDDASFRDTHCRLGGLIDTVVTAEMAKAYKPDLEMFNALFGALKQVGIPRERVLHVAQSSYHDIAPANELGLDVVWIDRRHGRPGQGVTVHSDAAPMLRFDNLEELCAALKP